MSFDLLRAMPLAVFATDAEGRLTFFNEAAVALWGRRPEPGAAWHAGWTLFRPDGRPLAPSATPIAAALREGRSMSGGDMVAERPDGSRIAFTAHAAPRDAAEGGPAVGTVAVLVDVTQRREAEFASAWLAATVASSSDAIVSKTLDGTITSWNAGAERIFGYSAAEAIGASIRMLVPPELQQEEDAILARLQRGERIEHFETERLRRDGRRVNLSISVAPIRDATGRLVGASKVGRDITGRKQAEAAAVRLAAIVSSSDDAIASKDLDGIVTSWNDGARRIFGYAPEEIVGRSVRLLIPPELQAQEDEILARIRRGERIEHFDTVRIGKDGRRIDVSLSISPLLDRSGRVVGASKIARDIRERKRAEELQRLLFNELNHRVKNTLATIQSIASQSMRTAPDPRSFVASFNGRVSALARAHDLLVEQQMKGARLADLVREQVVLGTAEGLRVHHAGPEVALDARLAVQLALVLHELATNARKYGALSVPEGALSVTWQIDLSRGRELQIHWQESGVPGLAAPVRRGFGTALIERSLQANRGTASLSFGPDGLTCEIRLPLPEQAPAEPDWWPGGENRTVPEPEPVREHRGRRVLLIEDEPLLAMQMEAELAAHGFEIVGPAFHVEGARRLIAAEPLDAALLDANLGGEPVDELAAALAERQIPFAFATGYGREALPAAFRDAVMVAKPFAPETLVRTLRGLLAEGGPPAAGRRAEKVVPLRAGRS